ncbi:MAG: HD domain-containing protein [Chlorobi bacterium]|nr:HD domain-containing protein [Chlorobiota bacterium]
MNRKKIINDPVYGIITIPSEFIYELLEHPYVQRLSRIKQLGLTYLVYPGAMHSRFHHALGATHLMSEAISNLKSKGFNITNEEAEAARIAILLHDIGHGPFSHTLENYIIEEISHEALSLAFMNKLNTIYKGKLELAIQIFNNAYPKKFLHQLVSSQLDMDRLDYLRRDSYFTGVSEGIVGSDRIIKMLQIYNDSIVIEEKGIYSIEKFLIARRLMYWQVYLHKTVLSADQLLIKILKRAKQLVKSGEELFASPALFIFLSKSINLNAFQETNILDTFSLIDDNDIITSIKTWINHSDKILSDLSYRLINRKLFSIKLQNNPFDTDEINKIKSAAKKKMKLTEEETDYYVFTDQVSNSAYSFADESITILSKTGKIKDIAEASDMLNHAVLSKTVKKYILCYPKEII